MMLDLILSETSLGTLTPDGTSITHCSHQDGIQPKPFQYAGKKFLPYRSLLMAHYYNGQLNVTT